MEKILFVPDPILREKAKTIKKITIKAFKLRPRSNHEQLKTTYAQVDFKALLRAIAKASCEVSAETKTAFRLIGVVKFRLCNEVLSKYIFYEIFIQNTD